MCSYCVSDLILGIFDMAIVFLGLAILILNVAFNAGSSKQGNAFLASVG